MKTKSIFSILVIGVVSVSMIFSSCKKNNNSTPPPSSKTALYDTLGWFIQGADGSMAIANQGTKMIPDPDNEGQKIQAGRYAIRTVVNKALGIIAADPKLVKYFPTLLAELGDDDNTGLSQLLNSFTDFVQQGVSGQKVYKGKNMVEVHNHATYDRFGSETTPTADSADFDQFVGDIVEAAQSLDVPNSVIGQLGTLLYSTEKDVVQDKTPHLATTPLYDTLGWFIQGAKGPIEAQGTKMVEDPENDGQMIQAGRYAIRTVVNKALGIIAADPKLSKYFPTLLAELDNSDNTGLSQLLNSFTDFVQQGVSGQKVYKGKSMVEVHNHTTYDRFGSTTTPTADKADFDQFVGDIAQAATDLEVPNSVIGQLGALLNSTENDVVQDK